MSPDGLWALLWGEAGQFHHVRVAVSETYIPVTNRRGFIALVRADDAYLSMVPHTGRDEFSLGAAHVIWARLETRDACLRLQRFRVPPTVVWREGASSRRVALWALSRPLSGDWITRATERLTYALKGRRGAADASALLPSPFTHLTYGRKTPSPVFVEYESDTRVHPRQIVGGLTDAPDPTSWREKAA